MLCTVSQAFMGEGFHLSGKPRQLMAVDHVKLPKKPLVGTAKLCTVQPAPLIEGMSGGRAVDMAAGR